MSGVRGHGGADDGAHGRTEARTDGRGAAVGGVQERVRRHLDVLVASGAETGVQVAVHHHGRLIVDAVAGTDEPDGTGTGQPLTSTTPVLSFSTGKNVSAVLAHLLVARGLLGYDSPVTDLWPEYGARGKAATTLRHVLTHTAGLPAMPGDITPAELPDWPRVCAALAAAEPRWRPGSAMGYHAYTFGHLVGELARRATGRPPSVLLRDWIAAPLGLTGQLWFGVPAAALPRLARVGQDARQWPPAPEGGAAPPLAAWESRPSAALGNDERFLRADVPSVASASALALATVLDALLRGTLVGAAQRAELAAPAFEGVDRVFGTPTRMALGFPLGRLGATAETGATAFGWPGGGGSYAYADPARGIAFALTKTRLSPDFATALSVLALLDDA
ncbi:serine hydrolase domain-containing protein [Streptomyces phytohabitans]|uniref:serine hydrolase domain-containing protein n=1 Tax=Streptomyces phytohabitans TaxID=1150371 RepID=UPI00345B9949